MSARWRLVRLACSPYETEEDQQAERAALAPLVDLRAPGQDAEILVAPSHVRVDEALLGAYPSVRVVQTTTSGYDHVDRRAAAARGLRLARLPMVRRDAVVEVSLALILRALHRLGELEEAAREGRWARAELPALGMRNLAGARVGLVGLGVIGARMAEVLRGLGAEVWGLDPAGLPQGVRAASLPEMVEACAVLSLHASLDEGSRGLVDGPLLARARGLALINTARGDLLDVEAALAALRDGRLAFLGLDVFPQEPWPRMALQGEHPGLVLLPHAAGFHRELGRRVREDLLHSIQALLAGQPMPWELRRP